MNKIDNLNNKKLEVSASALEQMKKILFSEKEGLLVLIHFKIKSIRALTELTFHEATLISFI